MLKYRVIVTLILLKYCCSSISLGAETLQGPARELYSWKKNAESVFNYHLVTEITNRKPDGRQTIYKFEHWKKEDNYRFDLKVFKNNVWETISIQAYNGEYVQYWTKDKGGYLRLSKKREKYPEELPLFYDISTKAFNFLHPNLNVAPEIFSGTPLNIIANNQAWVDYSRRIISDVVCHWGGLDYHLIRSNYGSFLIDEKGNTEKLVSEVYVSKDKYAYPVLNRILSSDGRLYSEFFVIEHNKGVWPYAVSAVSKHYQEKDVLLYDLTYKVLYAKINDDGFNDEIFTIDLASAALIFDEDLRKSILVPK
ncbi:MAG: hypothetical protein HC904_09465 [Blastochloris sp.]|nr:hypothetical protein [Blastochloris sp.]